MGGKAASDRGAEPLYRGEAITRASAALTCFSAARPRWTLAELSQAVGAPKETLEGILSTLARRSLLRRDGDGAYALGFAWLRLGSLRRNQFDVRTIAVPVMREIRDATNETVVLSMRVQDQRVHVEFAESTHRVRRLAQVGAAGPLHLGATGLALLGTLAPADLAGYFERREVGPAARSRIERELAIVRAQGYAAAVSTVNKDMAAVAAACRLSSGDAVSLTISCPVERYGEHHARAFAEFVTAGIARLAQRFG